MSSLSLSSENVFKKVDLSLKECLELYKTEKFTLETFLELRTECIDAIFMTFRNDYNGIISLIRGPFSDLFRQACTLFSTPEEESKIFRVACHKLFTMIMTLRSLAESLSCSQSELVQMWHSTTLACEALRPFSADFSPYLETILAEKAMYLIKLNLNERISLIPKEDIQNVPIPDDRNLNDSYNLSTTIVLNALIDAINQVRLYPEINEEDKFYWHKKRQVDERRGLTGRELEVYEAERREHNRLELERIRRQREEREILTAKKLEEKEKILMERERENLGDWEEKERQFHLLQGYEKVYKRIKEQRGRLLHLIALVTLKIPLIVRNETLFSTIFTLSEGKISMILNKIALEELTDCLDELNDLFVPFERDQKVCKFWNEFIALVEQKQKVLRENRHISLVKEEVNAIFSGKTVQKLRELGEGIKKKLKDPNVDSEYWTGLQVELEKEILKVQLDESYLNLKNRLVSEATTHNLDIFEFSYFDYKNENVPKFFSKQKATATGTIGEPEREDETPKRQRVQVLSDVNMDNTPAALTLFEQEQSRHVGKDELPFNAEAEDLFSNLEYLKSLQEPLWKLKYPNIKVKKPRFFNRVRMNYVWNKYNQTHYDTSNPPPKVVQGFRFNIFYPDLMDSTTYASTTIPSYRKEKDPTSPDNEIIRFSAGPPYSDVIFRIPKEEWDMSSQHGFKCIFERGTLRLHFWFRSQRYRR